MSITVLSYQSRLKLAELLEKHTSISAIAEELNASYSTVYCEITRGGGALDKDTHGYVGYSPDAGQAAVSGKYRKYRRLG